MDLVLNGHLVNLMEQTNLLPWSIDQVINAYEGISELIFPSHSLFAFKNKQQQKDCLSVLHGSAAHFSTVPENSIYNITVDPPYYDNVMYAELSDFFYVWLKEA